MRSVVVFLLAISAFAVSCTNRDAVPSDIIQPDSMQVILRQVIVADQFATQFLLKDSAHKDSTHRNVKAETLQLYETIFRLHHTSRQEFNKSLAFYNSRPDLQRKLFDSLSAYETRHRDELYKPVVSAPAAHPKDSLSRVRDSLAVHTLDSFKLHRLPPRKP
ncbi:MAG TPA: DUF4296 domain-containing protein [Puia sp.]|nr:DUF4296 domain-containing protein [Puia sp.]